METSTKKIEAIEQHNQEPLNGQFEEWEKKNINVGHRIFVSCCVCNMHCSPHSSQNWHVTIILCNKVIDH